MYNILVVAHYNLATSFVDTVKGITGLNLNSIYSCGLDLKERPECFKARVSSIIDKIYGKKPLLVFADLFGGTPCNTVISQVKEEYPDIFVIAGANLPMILEAYLYSEFMSLADVLKKLETSPKRTVIMVD